MTIYEWRVSYPGCVRWDRQAASSPAACAEALLRQIHSTCPVPGAYRGGAVRRIREVSPGMWRGLIGRVCTRTVQIREARS